MSCCKHGTSAKVLVCAVLHRLFERLRVGGWVCGEYHARRDDHHDRPEGVGKHVQEHATNVHLIRVRGRSLLPLLLFLLFCGVARSNFGFVCLISSGVSSVLEARLQDGKI